VTKAYTVLPCNGLDKCVGRITQEIALLLSEQSESKIICPVLYRVADKAYNKIANEMPLLVLDGCATRCASKLAAEKNLHIAKKIVVTEEAKAADIEIPLDLRMHETQMEFAQTIAKSLIPGKEERVETTQSGAFYPSDLSYESYRKDKFIFRVPTNKGFFFNENDVWVYISGSRARIGVTDYVQKSLSDIIFFSPPPIGTKVEQFDAAGEVESAKAVFEIISPVSGIVTAVNDQLVNFPERINENPYKQGWIVELELSNFEDDKDLLYSFEGYFPIMKRKVDAYHDKG